jgi:hypothetical protein
MKVETTIKYQDLSFDVSGTYIAGEAEVRYNPDMSGTPSSPSEFIITEVLLGRWDVTICLSDEEMQEICEIIINQIEE